MMMWNPWHGCRRVSRGCDRCYMYALDEARGVDVSPSTVRRTRTFDLPVARRRDGSWRVPSGTTLRVNMTSDTFIEDADVWRDEFWEIIAARSDVTFFLLTKRPERMRGHMPADWCDGWENVVVGLSCEDQRAFDTRWQAVLETPAKRRALNLAPLLGPIDIREAFRDTSLEDVACGGECYGGRPCDLDWVRDIRSQCESAGVEFTFWSTGDKIVDGGVERHIPSSRQHGDALRAVPPYHASRERRGDRRFAQSRCWQCPALYNCEGCVRCGRCVDACTVAYDVLAEARRRASLPL